MTDHILKLTDSQSPPHHEDSEYAAVGCALLDPTGGAVQRMNLLIEPQDFFDHGACLVFQACLDIANTVGAVDATFLHERLAETGTLTEIGGPMTLEWYRNAVNHTVHQELYARGVLKNSIRRLVANQARELFAAAWEAHEPLDTLQERIWSLWETLCRRLSALRPVDRECGGLQ